MVGCLIRVLVIALASGCVWSSSPTISLHLVIAASFESASSSTIPNLRASSGKYNFPSMTASSALRYPVQLVNESTRKKGAMMSPPAGQWPEMHEATGMPVV